MIKGVHAQQIKLTNFNLGTLWNEGGKEAHVHVHVLGRRVEKQDGLSAKGASCGLLRVATLIIEVVKNESVV